MPRPVMPTRSTAVPTDVIIRSEARRPETDPTLGIPVDADRQGTPRHRLVAIGDSITHGFQSGAIFKTPLSYPAMIANAMGWGEQFRYPTYDSPGGGLPLNLESLARQLEQRFGDKLDWLELPAAVTFVQRYLDQIEDYWERGAGSVPPDSKSAINHNLAVYGWDLRNTLSQNADILQAVLKAHPAKDNLLGEIVEYHNERAALRVLNSARDAIGNALSPLQAAAQLGMEGSDSAGSSDGIETLIIAIGANNALGSILTFCPIWSDAGYDEMTVNDKYTVWRPIHFQAELDRLVAEVKKIRARHVIFSTVPHVTIAPYARGVDRKVSPRSRYFPFYTLPWISDTAFNPNKHPHLTEQDARAIDSAIDQYNESIAEAVRSARQAGKDWYLFDLCGLLDRFAYRRYLTPESAAARPSWWDEVGGKYELPLALQALRPELDSRFFSADASGRIQGGIFALDGVHPTTVGYGILAQELIKIMQLAGVKFYEPDGRTERQGEVKIDFRQLIALDTLISNPPRSIASDLAILRWLDETFNVFGRLLKASF
jgi:GDSL-like Lipase/Acylhydrolase